MVHLHLQERGNGQQLHPESTVLQALYNWKHRKTLIVLSVTNNQQSVMHELVAKGAKRVSDHSNGQNASHMGNEVPWFRPGFS